MRAATVRLTMSRISGINGSWIEPNKVGNRRMYIWQETDWPHFYWDISVLQWELDAVRSRQGRLLGRRDAVDSDALQSIRMESLIEDALRTSEIEGELLDRHSVRSSVARQLGVDHAGVTGRDARRAEGLVSLLLRATNELERDLVLETLCQWQTLLFVGDQPELRSVRVGRLRGEAPMQVVSGRLDRPRVHFEAPPAERLQTELHGFLRWFNDPPDGLDAILRAGVAHLWFVTLHPFEDGNGRLARAITDRALAQAEQQTTRLYSLSEVIMARRQDYYDVLEASQKGSLDITDWLRWFLDCLREALDGALARIQWVLEKARFWQRHASTVLNARQVKVLNRLLDEGPDGFPHGINAAKYRGMAKVSKATATRDLTDLLAKGCLERLPGGGRSVRYRLLLETR